MATAGSSAFRFRPLAAVGVVLVSVIALAAFLMTEPPSQGAEDVTVEASRPRIIETNPTGAMAQRAVNLFRSNGLEIAAQMVENAVDAGLHTSPESVAAIAELSALVAVHDGDPMANILADAKVVSALVRLNQATRPPGLDPNWIPPGLGGVPPGQDDDFVPPGQDDDFVPPGQDDDFVPPGRDDVKPGRGDNTEGDA
jgi:hypothetical protein